ncbi:Subtilisin-like protease 9 [Madurella mycetomatis]|uniref:Subtilisin-like protease 9 n=1 Tax=Madurella mycetomatis TaxID=100816 RepID=A0A175W011_9PEZI|nr:Subtilisin-like protease 9 [Madurella mycetomatis]
MKLTTLCHLLGLIAAPLTLAAALVVNDQVPSELVVPNQYIVAYKADAPPSRRKDHENEVDGRAKKGNMLGLRHRIDMPGLQGYIIQIPISEVAALSECDLIDYIEKDTIVTTAAVAADPTLSRRSMVRQYNSPWGLARISHREKGQTNYNYDSSAGNGVRVYVLDSGIRIKHEEFGGRAKWGPNLVSDSPDTDETGHGTHVAGIIAGKTYGVAKRATVVSVKILDKNGTSSVSRALRGINWVIDDAKRRGVEKKAVINMSIAGERSSSFNAGVKAATDAGITVVAAAGNNGTDATDFSPASAASAITVGAIDEQDQRASFSNWGTSVDIFAPGVLTLSASSSSNSKSEYMSGTSMATPHVAGLAAYFISKEKLRGVDVADRIRSVANKGVGDREGSPDRIAYNGSG